MINRLIYNGKVYYKVADLAQLFNVSTYKMRKIVKTQGIGAPLPKGSGYGRALFVAEENVAKIEVRNEVKILKTEFTADPVKEVKTVKEPVIDVKKSKKPAKKAEKQNVDNVTSTEIKVENESNIDEIEALQEKHLKLRKKGSTLFRQFLTNNKQDLLHEICYKHLGKGKEFAYATLEDVPQMEATVKELEAEVAKWDESPNEVGKVKVSELTSEIENIDLNNLPNKTEPVMQQHV